MIKPIFSAAMSAVPYRKDFYAKLAPGSSDTTEVDTQAEAWVAALEERIAILKTFMASKEAKWY